jgi:small acid-soluble spore protein F (minor alpha/beta-type SASP)
MHANCFSGKYRRKGEYTVSRRKGLMSEQLKYEIAKELGVYDTVRNDGGWGNVSSRDCGNIVKKAIERAERSLNSR